LVSGYAHETISIAYYTFHTPMS